MTSKTNSGANIKVTEWLRKEIEEKRRQNPIPGTGNKDRKHSFACGKNKNPGDK